MTPQTVDSPPPLSPARYRQVYATVPRLTVELVLTRPGRVLLAERLSGPCRGLWHLPGGTLRFGERLADAVRRVARDELGIEVTVGELLGAIEYPGHQEHAGDWPVGLAFAVTLAGDPGTPADPGTAGDVAAEDPVLHEHHAGFFTSLPAAMHEEQRDFLVALGLGLDQADRVRTSV